MPSQWLKQWFPHLPAALDRAPMAGLMCAGALLLGVALAGARSSNPNDSGTAAADAAVQPGGEKPGVAPRFLDADELVEQSGTFGISGDRLTFVTANGGHRFIALENLPLEGVAYALHNHSASLEWVVSGKVTEFRGSHYLLLTRAHCKPEPMAAD